MQEKKALSTRIVGLVLAASLGGAILLIATFAAVTAKGFLDIENELTERGIARTRAILEHKVRGLSLFASEYARRDEVMRYIRGSDPAFVSDDLSPQVLERLGLDFVAIHGDDGELLSLVEGPRAPTTKAMRESIKTEAVGASTADSGRVGFIFIEGRLYSIAAAPVPKKEGMRASSAAIVCGQAMDEAYIAELAALAGLELRFLPYSDGPLHAPVPVIERRSLREPVIGRSVEQDPSGNPVIIIETREPRTVLRRGFSFFVAFILVAVFILVAAALGIRHAAHSFLIQPIEVLEAERSATERLEAEVQSRTAEIAEAKAALEVYKRIMEETSEGIVITDLEGNVQEVNGAYCRLSGYAREELLGQNSSIMQSGKHDEAFYQRMWETIIATGRWEGEMWDKRKDGTLFPKWLSIDTIRDSEGIPERYVWIAADISRMKETEANLNRLAFYDSLTGLPNRSLFADRFMQALTRAQRGHTRVALLYLDLDHFKDVNDGYGHHAGDELLCEAASRISAQVREADTVCRIGGDEFTVILESIKKSDDAAAVARKIVDTLREPFKLRDTVVYVGASVGIALYPYDGIGFEDLVKHADAAMYEAKEQGRGQFRFASGGTGTTSRRRIEMEARLRNAIAVNGFELYYQPQVSAGGAAVGSNAGLVGAEALVRLRAEDGSLIEPQFFIDAAEETGLVIQLGAWVLREACKEAKGWLDGGKDVPVSVNVSPRQFEHGLIVEQVSKALKESMLPPRLLRLEVSENLFMHDGDRNAAIIRELKELGVTFSVDDFGVSYSSLRYIDTIPIDSLKIDRAFIRSIFSRFDGGDVATAVIALARSFGLSSVAEGVETSGQLDAIRARGCDEVQGYYVSRPLNAKNFRAFLSGELPPQTPANDDEDEPGILEEVL